MSPSKALGKGIPYNVPKKALKKGRGVPENVRLKSLYLKQWDRDPFKCTLKSLWKKG